MINGNLQSETLKLAVKQHVDQLVNDQVWLESLEYQALEFIKQRVLTKFSDVSVVPDLVKAVQDSVEKLFNEGRIPGLSSFVDSNSLQTAIDRAVENMIQTTIDNLVVDSTWLSQIEKLVNQTMSAKLTKMMNEINLNQLIMEHIDSGIDRWQDRFRENFTTAGIKDRASTTQLTVMDNAVVVEQEIIANHLTIETAAEIKGPLTVDDLILRGRVNIDNASWSELTSVVSKQVLEQTTTEWKKSLVDEVLSGAKESGIDFKNVTVGGNPLVTENQLNYKITDSNIEKTGTLRDLTVAGKTRLANTVTAHNRRVGINTEDPEMALSIWDEEVAVILGKNAEKTAYIGTARSHNLVIGVNRKAAITVDTDGLTTVRQLRLDRFRLSHATDVPGHNGTRGDLVFNSDPKPNSPFAWVCLGGFKWQPLRSA
jgi:hypothetical protein